ncbi:hydroxyproline-2-epimerase [Nitritalea halalkaliphila LW7]|uniref:Hydroxyproline-2-epimerase n=1 Tax=Nitritalea halalkaliphila LW7 TaxID=1189621 RepID=I5C7E3_9BACT|nr:hydroxyproline-2-epimerase [Nitritalea halalkaliphila LW7]
MKKTFTCIDAHTCGNPVRLVTGGVPFLPGTSISEKRAYFMEHLDWNRTHVRLLSFSFFFYVRLLSFWPFPAFVCFLFLSFYTFFAFVCFRLLSF